MTTLTRCEQAALDLATLRARYDALISGVGTGQVGHADKTLRFQDANLPALERRIRQLENEVDACNGCKRSRGRFVRMTADDGCW